MEFKLIQHFQVSFDKSITNVFSVLPEKNWHTKMRLQNMQIEQDGKELGLEHERRLDWALSSFLLSMTL